MAVGLRAGETYYELIGSVGAAMSLSYGGRESLGAKGSRRSRRTLLWRRIE